MTAIVFTGVSVPIAGFSDSGLGDTPKLCCEKRIPSRDIAHLFASVVNVVVHDSANVGTQADETLTFLFVLERRTGTMNGLEPLILPVVVFHVECSNRS